jgi:hypothetical protein
MTLSEYVETSNSHGGANDKLADKKQNCCNCLQSSDVAWT